MMVQGRLRSLRRAPKSGSPGALVATSSGARRHSEGGGGDRGEACGDIITAPAVEPALMPTFVDLEAPAVELDLVAHSARRRQQAKRGLARFDEAEERGTLAV